MHTRPDIDRTLSRTKMIQSIRFKSPDYSSQKGERFTKQNKKVLNSLNRKIFLHASKLLQSHWPIRYFFVFSYIQAENDK